VGLVRGRAGPWAQRLGPGWVGDGSWGPEIGSDRAIVFQVLGKGPDAGAGTPSFVPLEQDRTHREIDMTKSLVKTQIRLRQLVANREAGQGTLEYVGMIIVASIIVVAVLDVLGAIDLGAIFQTNVEKVTNRG
jgi:hypothetical protein